MIAILTALALLVSSVAYAATVGATDSTGQIVQVIKEVGVPVAMLMWFAWRDRAQMTEVIKSLQAIALALSELRNASERVAEEVTGRHNTLPTKGKD